ncbi:MAG: hypothetical protein RR356_05755 [Bacteroidales bacterium]
MKKSILVIALAICSILITQAQPRAIGGRLGTNFEVSYQHDLSKSTFLQIDAGTQYWFQGIQAEVTHNWIFATPNWTPKGTWEWYAGVGIGGGYSWWGHHYYYSYYDNISSGYGFLGVTGMVGLSYTFWFPLQLSVDFRPTIGPKFGNFYSDRQGYHKVGFYANGLYDIALSVRYKF